ncbi:hypothetical protein CYMTET_52017 [Cymbomonas tetramitiformis]|uniref:Uncharacterized protein n=1 Tax=Cymbomonas tetramitiformis TaxID=36881 RepID=A0AAE0ET51_9CHLO|nr:hypothetical protein CYMTET_52017 [Cymbomonas tetramitiformis]
MLLEASNYWHHQQGPPVTISGVKRRRALSHHVRARCGQKVLVRMVKTLTGQTIENFPDTVTLNAILLGPYPATDVTPGGHWTMEKYEQEKFQGEGLRCTTLRPLRDNPGCYEFAPIMEFIVTGGNMKGYRLGIKATCADSLGNNSKSPWTRHVLVSDTFRVHNIRSINHITPEHLPQGENARIVLLRGVGEKGGVLSIL